MKQNYSLRRVLVADDEEPLANALSQAIEHQMRCHPTVVNDGDAVLSLLASEAYDVLLTDMLMPGVHGLDLVERVRAMCPTIRIIVMTAYTTDFPFVEVIKRGADSFIAKPCQLVELEAHLLRAFRECDLQESIVQERARLLEDMRDLEAARILQAVAEEKYRSLFEFSMNGELILEPDTWIISEANRAFCDLASRDHDILVKSSFLDMVVPSEIQRFTHGATHFAETRYGTLADIGLIGHDGNVLRVDISLSYIGTNQGRMVLASFHDMSEQREMQRKLVDVASKDSLTGLLNKRAFYARLEGAVVLANKQEAPMVLLFMDLDNFKGCNDTYGHQAGDAILIRTGEIIQKHIRADRDYGFRFGGDEFAALLVGVGKDIGRRAAERMRNEFNETNRYGTSISIGVAEFHNAMDVDEFVHIADSALYQAKSEGKNTICTV